MGFEALETSNGTLESSFEADFGKLQLVRSRVWPDPLPAWVQTHNWQWVWFGRVSPFRGSGVGELIFIFCTFLELMRCYVRIRCCKRGVLHHDRIIVALLFESKNI
jgi:hypothetical protein